MPLPMIVARNALLAGWLVLSAGCAHRESRPPDEHHGPATVPAGPEGRSYVPELPPDSISQAMAEEIFAEDNRVYSADGDWFYLRNIIRLYYVEDTPRHLRQEAMDLIGGEVIGGHRMVANGGLATGPLEGAIEKLLSLPYVASAGEWGHFGFEVRSRHL